MAKNAVTIQNNITTNSNRCTDAECCSSYSPVCVDKKCDHHCRVRHCPLHLPLHLLRRNSEDAMPEMALVNGMWIRKNSGGSMETQSICSLETMDDHSHFREVNKRLDSPNSLKRDQLEKCAICFEPMCLELLCVLFDDDSKEKRACDHVFHVRCVESMMKKQSLKIKDPAHSCPFCRARFTSVKVLPRLDGNPESMRTFWNLLTGGSETTKLSRKNASTIARYTVPLSARRVSDFFTEDVDLKTFLNIVPRLQDQVHPKEDDDSVFQDNVVQPQPRRFYGKGGRIEVEPKNVVQPRPRRRRRLLKDFAFPEITKKSDDSDEGVCYPQRCWTESNGALSC